MIAGVELDLRTARKVLGALADNRPFTSDTLAEIAAAVARTEARLRPRAWERWLMGSGKRGRGPYAWDRGWPDSDHLAGRVYSELTDTRSVGVAGWFAQGRDGRILGHGPEVGEAGRAACDERLRRYIRRHGVAWSP